MKKYIKSGFITDSPQNGAFDIDKYLLDFLSKETCCVKSLAIDTITEMTAAAGVTIDGVLLKDGSVTSGSFYAGLFLKAAPQALSGAGAANVTSYHTRMTSTGAAQAVTLADGTKIGQLKKLSHVVDGGSIVLTPANFAGTTITFTTVGEYAILLWDGTEWNAIEIGNTATPGTLPAIA